MGLYNVVKPCVVGNLHYARPTTKPIDVDDDVAAPLVEAGQLAAVEPVDGVYEAPALSVGFVEEPDPEPGPDPKPHRSRRRDDKE